MKWTVRILLPTIVLAACIYGDVVAATFLFSKLPALGDWLFWAKLGIGVGLFWLTAGIIALFVVLAGILAAALTED